MDPRAAQIPQNRHADDRLILAFAGAILALRIPVFARLAEQFDDAPEQRTVIFGDFDERSRLVRIVVDGFPCAERCLIGSENGTGEQKQRKDE